MIKFDNKFTYITLGIFFLLELVLAVIIQLVSGVYYGISTLTSVSIACIVVGIFYKQTDKHLLTIIALITTVCADLFLCGLVKFHNDRVVAMVFFCVTQICYFYRLYLNQEYTSTKRVHLALRVALPAAAIIATLVVLKDNADTLAIISMFYFANLLLNVVYAFIQFKRAPLFAIGLLCFALCDVLIGFAVLDEFMTIPPFIKAINDIDLNLAWIFYVPSQTLIATDIAINEND